MAWRKSSRAWIVIVTLGCVALSAWDADRSHASAFAPPKKKPRSGSKRSRVLRVGDRVTVKLNGDEARFRDGVARSGAATADTLVLAVYDQGERAEEINDATHESYNQAVRAGDPAGIAEMIRAGRAVKVKAGTKAIAIEYHRPVYDNYHFMPATPGGLCVVRIADGPAKDKICEVAVRNLKPDSP